MGKGKNFSEFTYGVGLEITASSFKQVKDDLKLNLDNLAKLVKGYGKILKINPNADLSELFAEVQKIKSITDGINSSDNSFADFVDKGTLDRISALESGLQKVSSSSAEVETSLAGLKSGVAAITEMLKSAGAIKFPATFDNLFGDVKDQSTQIQHVKDQIKSMESGLSKLKELWEDLGSPQKNESWNSDEILDWIARIGDIKDELTDTSNLDSKKISSFVTELQDIGMKLGSAIASMSSDQLKSFQLNDEYVISEIDECIKAISTKKQELDKELQSLNGIQEKYKASLSAKSNVGQSLGVAKTQDGGNYTLKAKIIPDTDEAVWTDTINDTIKNVEPKLKRIKLTPTFSKGKNVEKEVEGSLAQINHAIDVDFKVNDNIEKFEEKIKKIDSSITNAQKQLQKNSTFYVRFEYEEGGRFADAVYKVINKLKRIEAKFYIANGKKFISDVSGIRDAAKKKLKEIPASISLNNENAILQKVDNLRTEIDKKIGNIDIKLNMPNIPFERLGAPTDGAVSGVENLSKAAQEAQLKMQKMRQEIESLKQGGFKATEFLSSDELTSNFRTVNNSNKRIKELVSEHDALSAKLSGEKEDVIKRYLSNGEGLEEFKRDISRIQAIESELTTQLERQIAYRERLYQSAKKTLDAELQVEKSKEKGIKPDEKEVSEETKPSKQADSKTKQNKELAMSAEEATKKIRSLNGTLVHQRRIMKDLDKGVLESSSFVKLGEWDNETQSFKKNSKEIEALLVKYKKLKQAREASGGTKVVGEEAKLRGQLGAILRSQKKHMAEIIATNEEELTSVKNISEAYKKVGDSKTKIDVDTKSTTKKINELTATLKTAKSTLSLLESKKFGALGKTGLGDINKRLNAAGSRQSFNELIDFYNRLIAKRDELEKAGKTGSSEYIQCAKIYQGIEQQLNVIYQDQLKYTQSRIQQLETEISKEKEILQLRKQQKQESGDQAGSGDSTAGDGNASATVKLDGKTLNSLAKDATLKSIDGKVNNILQSLGKGINITGSNISIEASNVSVSGGTSTAASESTDNGTTSSSQQSANKEIASSAEHATKEQKELNDELAKTQQITQNLSSSVQVVSEKDGKIKRSVDTYRSGDKVDEVQEISRWVKHDKDDPGSLEHVSTVYKTNIDAYNKLYQDFINALAKQKQIEEQIATANGPTAKLQAELNIQKGITENLELQLSKHDQLYTEEAKRAAVAEATKKAHQELAKITGAQSDKDVKKQNLDLMKTVDNAQKKYKDMQNTISSFKVPMADSAIAKFKEYESLLTTLQRKQSEIDLNPDLLKNEDYSNRFTSLLQQMQKVESEFLTLQKSSEGFLSRIRSVEDIKPLEKTFDAANLDQLHNAMKDFANQAGIGATKLIEFNDAERTATFEIKDGRGQVQQLIVEYDAATNSLGRYTSKTRESLSESQKFFKSLGHSFGNVARYIASFGSIYRLFAIIKQGVTYIQEIDSALTELKKVTDETDASYDKFLQDMSKTAGVVGSTVSDLTTMSAEWARLGYSMEEAGKLAKSTAILLNVSEFDDATAASEALISTMQAFQYTADESQHVVDVLNEVGFKMPMLYSNI